MKKKVIRHIIDGLGSSSDDSDDSNDSDEEQIKAMKVNVFRRNNFENVIFEIFFFLREQFFEMYFLRE